MCKVRTNSTKQCNKGSTSNWGKNQANDITICWTTRQRTSRKQKIIESEGIQEIALKLYSKIHVIESLYPGTLILKDPQMQREGQKSFARLRQPTRPIACATYWEWLYFHKLQAVDDIVKHPQVILLSVQTAISEASIKHAGNFWCKPHNRHHEWPYHQVSEKLPACRSQLGWQAGWKWHLPEPPLLHHGQSQRSAAHRVMSQCLDWIPHLRAWDGV